MRRALPSASLPAAALALASLAACGEPEFTEAQTLGGVAIDAATLNRGRELYILNCYACHGMKGDGNGPAAPGLRPPPRNFTQGFFKFAATIDDEDEGNTLPRDEELLRLVKNGLHGTPMLPWDLKDAEVLSILHYIKTFSERWRTNHPGKTPDLGEDPFAGNAAQAVERGRGVYHATARCWNCHPSYLTKAEFHASTGVPPENDARDDYYRADLKSSGAVLALPGGATREVKVLPPDFLAQPVRSIYEVRDVFRVVATGVGGAAMPAFPLGKEDGWALAHYVWSLIQMRDTPAGNRLKADLLAQPTWTPPPPPEPPALPPGEGGAPLPPGEGGAPAPPGADGVAPPAAP